MTLLKDLIHIPERVHQGDFVLQLSKGVTEPEQTLRDYVVTPQLVDAFANALGFIQQAVQTGHSKAAYLHGSFGAGKSHFMAVLNLLLSGNIQARATPELAEVVARHDWTNGRRFLLVPYHMIGSRDMESAILGQYAEFVRQKHPNAPVPGFYLAEGLFKDACDLRARMGDAAFFAKLNEGANTAATEDGWGTLDTGWDAISFEAAMLEAPNGEERTRLVGDLITQFFSAYRRWAGSGEAFVSLDDGLSIMSRHAKALGYDAVILFLDELVLWLASHAADVNFVSREGTKLVKLVEATNADRPVPLISFVARQRDLRDLVGEHLAGAVQVQFGDVLKHWEARFHRITLEDRNLPAIAQKRVLRPVSEAARQTLQTTFDELRLRKEVADTLLTTTADREMFRQVYPFSPALVQTLIAVSAVLQRERTALKLMLQLLVDRRDDLQLGQLIPVGDLYDAIAEGDEPFSDGMRLHFDNAKRLYRQRLLPMLERQHSVTWEALRLGQAEPNAARNLRNDARLLKTLLLGALVPEVESLKALSAQRLAALNHGTFRSPIPGREAQDVLRKCRDWASEVGELKVTEDQNPIISIQVTGVDIEPILRAAESTDNPGNRRKRIREALFKELEIDDTGGLFNTYTFAWRGTRREVELLFENVREMTDERLRGRPGTWTVVLDFPFDDANYTPSDDLARLGTYQGADTQTLVWLPSFLSPKALADLGRLVVLDHVLQGDRFESYAGHLSLVDRVQAKALARNQLDQLRIKLRSQLEVAYGISTEPRDAVSNPLTPDQQFRSLDPTFSPRPPVGANVKTAFDNLLGQLLAHQYPAHPEFDTDIKPATLRKVWPEVQKAIEAPGQRGLVQDSGVRRLVRSVVNPCQLGQMAETHLLMDPHWPAHFSQCQARYGQGPLTVAQLRRWIDLPTPKGLPLELQNLIILAFAAATRRSFLQRGGPVEPTIDQMADELELREQSLPSVDDWQEALQRAASLFGLTLGQTLNAANVSKLVSEVRQKVADKREAIARLVAQLRDRVGRYAASATGTRQQTAESAQALLAALTTAADADVVAVLARAELHTSEAAVGRTLGQAKPCADALETGSHWPLFDAVLRLQDTRATPAQEIARRLREALCSDEHVVPLKTRLDELQRDATHLLTVVPPPPPPAPTPTTPAAQPPVVGGHPGAVAPPTPVQPPTLVNLPPLLPQQAPEVVAEAQQQHLRGAQALAALEALKARLGGEPDLELTLSWRLLRKGPQP